jgi:FkbH-like protein
MSSDIYRELRWLQKAPEDFRKRCKEATIAEGTVGAALRSLAGHSLDENQLNRLAETLQKLRADRRDLAPLAPFKLGIVSNSTTDFLVPSIVGSSLRYGLAIECIVGHYDQVVQSAIDPESPINKAQCDAVLVSVDFHGLPLSLANLGVADRAAAQVATAVEYLQSIAQGFRAHGKAACLLQTLARPPELLFGNLDRTVPGTWVWLVDAFNRRLAESIADGDVLLDVAGMAETVGLANWHDPTLWNLAKVPFAGDYLPFYADQVGRLLGAMRGKSRRTLIMDLDNTLWQGVIGDDGCDGIVCGQGDPTGEAHLALQASALALRERGVVLAVSSKNDDEIARQPFRQHPDMLLREEHITVFQANWNDKPSNIAAIAKELSLGIDAMTFIDDNPFERNFVRDSLPTVAVPELPDDPALYARTLMAGGFFETLTFSGEDRDRANFYRDDARRLELQEKAGDLDGYLRSLEMQITFQPFDAGGRARIAQLISKSNQFNLTTRRYTVAEVEAMEHNSAVFTRQVRLRDRFGDNGMISVIICREAGEDWEIDTWLMSCRVLGRRVESAVLREILRNARARGARRLIGRYVPSERNSMVRDHYQKLGFGLLSTLANGETLWMLPSDHEVIETIPMAVVDLDQQTST